MKKKQPAKKATKKASKPSVKLIEGQYSHKFLTRLKPNVGEILGKLMLAYREKTFNGAIVKIIEDVAYLKQKNQELENKLSASQNKFYILDRNVNDFKDAFETLFEKKTEKDIESDFENERERCPECNSLMDENNYCDECEEYQ